jgi:hypothetical protein
MLQPELRLAPLDGTPLVIDANDNLLIEIKPVQILEGDAVEATAL